MPRYRLSANGQWWEAYGRPAIYNGPPAPLDAFTVGVTEPTTSNVGTGLAGAPARTNLDTLGSFAGYATEAEADANPIKNVNLACWPIPTGGYVTFENALFVGGATPPTTSTGLLNCNSTNVQRVKANFCTFDPAVRSYWLDGMQGHHMTAYRSVFRHVVDGMGSFNTHGPRTDNKMIACLVENLSRFDVDASHTDGTHNDAIQHQGGIGLLVQGNAFHGYTAYLDDSQPADPWGRTAQCVLIQENVAIGGVYSAGEFSVLDNWVYGFMHVFVFKTRASGGTPFDVTLLDNRLMNDDQRQYSGSGTPPTYVVRLGSETSINGIQYATTGATRDTFGSHYDTGTGVVDASLRGRAVDVRRDPTPG